MTAQVIVAVLVGLAAAIEDLARRRVSNWIPLAALAGGLAWHIAQAGWRGALTAAGGAAAGLAIFLVFYLVGGMGGGDVKLMAGFGSLLGAGRLLEAALWTGAAGGLMALAVLAVGALRSRPVRRGESIPYAPAIAVGAWLSLIPKG
ncbi:MAG: prepilin peptidase [Acidobacteria bacterium]|nr:prepilin peptidase [Acidobacteriota bacterium]